MPVQTIVVAEDEAAIADLLSHHLLREGFSVVGARDGHAALRAARSVADLLVLDVGLPGVDGYDVARALRRERLTLPIVMLTARTDEVDRIVGLELGADDYICKPFSPREVVGRIKAILRRRNGESSWERSTLVFGPIEIDERAREVRVEGVDIKLRPREFVLFVELASNPGIAISRDRLVQKLWGIDYVGDERTVDVHIHRLRARLDKPWKLGYVVSTIKSFGYKFVRP